MAKRKVDEALERMDAAAHEWSKAARLILRYGNLDDIEELRDRGDFMLFVLEERGRDLSSEAVTKRLWREVDAIVADGVARGRWPKKENEDG